MEDLIPVTRPPMPERQRPITIIGAGGIVRDAHLPAYAQAGFHVTGITNRDRRKAEKLAAAYSIPRVYDSLDEAISESPEDVVFDVALPAALHTEVLAQLPRGSTVLLQKPMGENIEQAQSILEVCEGRELTAAVNFQLRFAPFVIAARDLINHGVIGELVDLEIRVAVETPWHLWTFLEGVPFAEIYYHSIHYLDLVRSFFGDPGGIYAKTFVHPDASRIDGTCSTYILDYGNQYRATITANHHARYGLAHQEAWIQWSGTTGAIRASLGLLMNYPHGVPDVFELCTLESDPPAWRTLDISGSWFPEAFIGTMSSVMRVAEGTDSRSPTDVADAYQTMRLVDAACRSSDGGAVPLSY
jgi:predicted dehydrogenase